MAEFEFDREDMKLGDIIKMDLPVYVFCGNLKEFLQFQSDYPNLKCEYIVDNETIRGRTPGIILRRGTWYGHPFGPLIEQQIDCQRQEWATALSELNSETGEDISYGV